MMKKTIISMLLCCVVLITAVGQSYLSGSEIKRHEKIFDFAISHHFDAILLKKKMYGSSHRVTYNASSKYMAVMNNDFVNIIDIANRKTITVIEDMSISYAEFSPDARYINIHYKNWPMIRRWDVKSGNLMREIRWANDISRFCTVTDACLGQEFPISYSPDGRYVAMGIDGHGIKVWNTMNAEKTKNIFEPNVHRVIFDETGEYLVSLNKHVEQFNREDELHANVWNLKGVRKTARIVLPNNNYLPLGYYANTRKLILLNLEKREEHVETWDISSNSVDEIFYVNFENNVATDRYDIETYYMKRIPFSLLGLLDIYSIIFIDPDGKVIPLKDFDYAILTTNYAKKWRREQ